MQNSKASSIKRSKLFFRFPPKHNKMGIPSHSNLLLPHALLPPFLVIITAICSRNQHLTVSAMQQHALSPAPAPSPSHHHHHHHQSHHVVPPSPAHSPASPPHSAVNLPTQPPAYTPVKPPAMSRAPGPAPHPLPLRKLVAVQGVVYCKNCSYSGVDTLLGASPLSGAKVELRCKNTKYMIKKASTTDKNGFFFLQAPKHITTYGAHKCLVFLSTNSNSGACTRATNLNGGVSGAFLFFDKSLAPPPKPQPFTVYTVGPFAFEPSKCYGH